jgi:hypothetical protein
MGLTEKEVKRIKDRHRILPVQLERARKRVEMLENEARRLGRHELLVTEKE